MTEDEKLRVLNTAMWLQVAVYSCDNVEDIKRFNVNRVKYLMNNTVKAILQDHGRIFTALWKEDGVQMGQVTKVMEEFGQAVAEVDYWKLPEVTQLIKMYQNGEFEHLFTQENETSRGND